MGTICEYVTEGLFNEVPVAKIQEARTALLSYIKKKHKKLIDTLNTGAKPEDKVKETIKEAAKEVASEYKG